MSNTCASAPSSTICKSFAPKSTKTCLWLTLQILLTNLRRKDRARKALERTPLVPQSKWKSQPQFCPMAVFRKVDKKIVEHSRSSKTGTRIITWAIKSCKILMVKWSQEAVRAKQSLNLPIQLRLVLHFCVASQACRDGRQFWRSISLSCRF